MPLHWQLINAHKKYKLSVTRHSFYSCLSPIYFSDQLSLYTLKIFLRSSYDNGIPCINKQRTKTFGKYSFSFAATKICNSLPLQLRHTDFVKIF